jgi:tetratricopeptide (TPR) repeat protein
MLPCAPTIALGHACAALAHHKEALDYYERSFQELPNDATRYMQSIVALPSVVSLRDLKYAAVIAARLFTTPPPPLVDEARVAHEASGRDFALSQAVAIAVETLEKTDAVAVFDEVIDTLRGFTADGGTELEVLRNSIDGIKMAVVDGADTVLATAYRSAIGLRAYVVARDLAWVWCHRHFVSRPKPIRAIILWQWRLAWLSIRTLATDHDNLRRCNHNQRVFWERIDSSQPSDMVKEILSPFSNVEMGPDDLAQAVVDNLTRIAFDTIGFSDCFPELGDMLRAGLDGEWIGAIRHKSVVQLLNFVLSPAAGEIAGTLRSSLDSLAETLRFSDTQRGENIRKWREAVDVTNRIFSHLVDHVPPTPDLAKAFLTVRPFVPELGAESGAHWFVAYFHCLSELGDDMTSTLEAQVKHLSSNAIGAFVERTPGLAEHNRARLTLLGLDVDGRAAFAAFSAAVAVRCYQEQSQLPIHPSVVEKASADYLKAKENMDAVLKKYSALAESLEKEEYAEERLTCVFQMGSLRAGYGGARVLTLLRDREAAENELKTALEELKTALSLAGQMSDNSRSAMIAGRIAMAASLIGDEAAAEQYVSLARSYGADTNDPVLEGVLASVETNRVSGRRLSSPRKYENEHISRIAGQLMNAHGWPEDRRKHVEDDLRKLSRVDETKSSFCKHLEALQNLTHTLSPSTSYTRPTQYTCKCLRFGHQTVIEHHDIDVVISAMQRTYCEECNHREPGSGEP